LENELKTHAIITLAFNPDAIRFVIKKRLYLPADSPGPALYIPWLGLKKAVYIVIVRATNAGKV